MIRKTNVTAPTYLKKFETEFDKIHLIFSKKPSLPSFTETGSPIKPDDDSFEEETIEQCDLTGDPLKVDLGDDDLMQIEKTDITYNNWTNEEAKHFPLCIRDARREINRIFRDPKTDSNDLPVYVVCNGDDQQRTILLGGHKGTVMSCGVHDLGFVHFEDDEIKINKFIEDHYRNCIAKDIEVQYLVKMRYNLYGKPLGNVPTSQNISIREVEQPANVCIDLVCQEPVFKISEATKVHNMELKLETTFIAGHSLLALNSFWKELEILHSFIGVLLNSDLILEEETVLCKDPLDSNVILQNIIDLVKSRFDIPPPRKNVIDLNNLRHKDFLDKLWDILKYCETISILRNSLYFLFEELANSDVQILKIQDSYSNISNMINKLLKKEILLAGLTVHQCVESLFELGAQKLKFDFQTILEHYCSSAKTNIETVWKTFFKSKPQQTRATMCTARFTELLKTADLTTCNKQLAYLSQLYLASEFIYLIKDLVHLEDQHFYSFCEHVVKKYVENPSVLDDFLEISRNPLCQMSFELDAQNTELIKDLLPCRWTMYMTSEANLAQVTTIYDLSNSPVFPPVISNHDVPVSNTNMLYYVTKMDRKKESI